MSRLCLKNGSSSSSSVAVGKRNLRKPEFVIPDEFQSRTKYDCMHLQLLGFLHISYLYVKNTDVLKRVRKAIQHEHDVFVAPRQLCGCEEVISSGPKCGNEHMSCFLRRAKIACPDSCGSDCMNGWLRNTNDIFPDCHYAGHDKYGLCLCASVPIAAKSAVVEYCGIITKGKILPNQPYGLKVNRFPGPKIFVDARRFGSEARMIAHDNDPNCEAQEWICDGKLRLIIFAIKDISAGNPLTLKYPQLVNRPVHSNVKNKLPAEINLLALLRQDNLEKDRLLQKLGCNRTLQMIKFATKNEVIQKSHRNEETPSSGDSESGSEATDSDS